MSLRLELLAHKTSEPGLNNGGLFFILRGIRAKQFGIVISVLSFDKKHVHPKLAGCRENTKPKQNFK